MRSGPVVMALATGLLPAGVLGAAINLDVCSVESVLEYFTCMRPVPADCFDNLAEQATAWCGNYLSIEPVTVYRSTVAPVSTETVTEVATAITTSVEVDITTVEVPQIVTVTDVEEAVVTETVTVSGQAVATLKRRILVAPTAVSATASASAAAATAAPSCIDLSKKDLLHHPAARLSRACSCLNPQPTTITLDATTISASTETVTETSTVLIGVSETIVSTELATSVTTQDVTVTVTSTATATATVTPTVPDDPCDHRYTTTLNLSQISYLLKDQPGVATSKDCCRLCYNTVGCAGAISPVDGQCGLMIPQGGSDDPDPKCPGGWEALNFVSPADGGAIFKGPCWIGGY